MPEIVQLTPNQAAYWESEIEISFANTGHYPTINVEVPEIFGKKSYTVSAELVGVQIDRSSTMLELQKVGEEVELNTWFVHSTHCDEVGVAFLSYLKAHAK